MNLDNIPKNKNIPVASDDFLDDFDFRPITSGLGFHHNKVQEIKPIISEKPITPKPMRTQPVQARQAMDVYQNDLSLFYHSESKPEMVQIQKEEKVYKLASKIERISAYLTDLALICGVLSIVLTVMARTTRIDLMDIWMNFPYEITPLVVILFCGFYLMYFSIFEKTAQSTLGKYLFKIRVLDINDKNLSLMNLLLRSSITLMNFLTLGLFSYFDLQNKVTQSKVVRAD